MQLVLLPPRLPATRQRELRDAPRRYLHQLPHTLLLLLFSLRLKLARDDALRLAVVVGEAKLEPSDSRRERRPLLLKLRLELVHLLAVLARARHRLPLQVGKLLPLLLHLCVALRQQVARAAPRLFLAVDLRLLRLGDALFDRPPLQRQLVGQP
eukprot:1114629-Prymnesium_polylepis.2